MSHAYPLMLDVSDRLIVIVGGGNVASRKAAGLLAAGATRVRVVSPEFSAEMPTAVQRVVGRYAAGQLEGAGLVFAATNDRAVNDAVVRDARAMGVLVCRADGNDDQPGDFSTPAVQRQGPVTIAVSTAGSPALAAKIRDAIAVDPDLLAMAQAMQTLRPTILADPSLDEPARRELFRKLASNESIAVLRQGGLNALRQSLVPLPPGEVR